MKTLLSLTALMVTGSIFAACQSGTYRITGNGDMLQDGDTLFLTSDFIYVPYLQQEESGSDELAVLHRAGHNQVDAVRQPEGQKGFRLFTQQ